MNIYHEVGCATDQYQLCEGFLSSVFHLYTVCLHYVSNIRHKTQHTLCVSVGGRHTTKLCLKQSVTRKLLSDDTVNMY